MLKNRDLKCGSVPNRVLNIQDLIFILKICWRNNQYMKRKASKDFYKLLRDTSEKGKQM